MEPADEDPLDRDGDGRQEKARKDGVTDADLAIWVQASRVTHEIRIRRTIEDSSTRDAGFDVTLRADRPEGCSGDPTCEACDRAVERLFALLEDCLPVGTRHVHEPFDHSFHLRPETGFDPELQVVVSVFPLEGSLGEEAEAHAPLLDVVVRDLERRGVQPRVFRASASVGPA